MVHFLLARYHPDEEAAVDQVKGGTRNGSNLHDMLPEIASFDKVKGFATGTTCCL